MVADASSDECRVPFNEPCVHYLELFCCKFLALILWV